MLVAPPEQVSHNRSLASSATFLAVASRAKQWVDLLDEGRVSLNLAHPPSGGTIPVNTEFAILRSPPDRLRSLLLHPGSDAVVYPSVIAPTRQLRPAVTFGLLTRRANDREVPP
jgi:hypothetical protein